MSLISDRGAREQIEFVFDLTFEKILHIPKQATEIQVLWTKGKRTGQTSTAMVNSNTATWGADGVNSIKVVSSLFKDPCSSTFMPKTLILEVVAIKNKKAVATLSYCTLNLASYALYIFDIHRPSATIQIHEKMAQGCVACIGITSQFLQAKIGDWQPAETTSSYYRNHAQDEEPRLVLADVSPSKVPPAIMEQLEQLKISKLSSKKFKMIGPVDERASMYIGDASIELLLRIFSKYDYDRSGRFQIEQVACILSEIGQSAIADDLRAGKAALSQNLDIFASDGGVLGSALDMNFSSFLSWISANRLASNLHVVQSARGHDTAASVAVKYSD
jgi:hypothetical protein